jgi:hypothetical protein
LEEEQLKDGRDAGWMAVGPQVEIWISCTKRILVVPVGFGWNATMNAMLTAENRPA